MTPGRNVDSKTPSEDTVIAALCAALAPYPWRRFTPELLARFALAARDRQDLAAALAQVDGAEIGTWERLEPADRADARVPRVVDSIADLRWPDLSLLATCQNVVRVLGRELR